MSALIQNTYYLKETRSSTNTTLKSWTKTGLYYDYRMFIFTYFAFLTHFCCKSFFHFIPDLIVILDNNNVCARKEYSN